MFSIIKSPRWQLFIRNLALLTLGELLSRVAMTVAFIHLARTFDPETYGYVELALAVNLFSTLIIDMGLGTLGTREVARSQSPTDDLVSRIVSTQLVLAGVSVLVLAGVVVALPLDATLETLLLGYTFCLLGYPLTISWFFQAQGQMMWVIIPQILRQTIFAAFVLLLLNKPEQALLLPLAEFVAVAAAATMSATMFLRDGNRLTFGFEFGQTRQLIAEAIPIGGSQMIWALRMYLPTILLAVIAGGSAVGFYGLSHRIVMTLQTLLEVYFRNLLPFMSQVAMSAGDRLQQLLRHSMMIVLIPCLAVALFITFTAPNVIGFIFGMNYVVPEVTTVLAILIWMIPILAWRRHARNALIALSCQQEELLSSLIGFGLLLSLIFPLTYAYSVLGTSVAMVISECIPAALAWWYVRRNLRSLKVQLTRA